MLDHDRRPAPTSLPAPALAGLAVLALCTALAASGAASRDRPGAPGPLTPVRDGGAPPDLRLSAEAQRSLGLQLVEARAPARPEAGGVLVPASGLVLEAGGGAHVWLALGEGRFVAQPVTPDGPQADGWQPVSGGLAAGGLAAGTPVVAHGTLFFDRAARRD